MTSTLLPLLAFALLGPGVPAPATAAHATTADEPACRTRDFDVLRRNPSREELRCRFGIEGPGRFGLLSYVDLPVYQPATPMPGTHLVGVPGHARPLPWESYEEWEWRVLRTEYGPEVHRVHRDLQTLHPAVAERIVRLEEQLRQEGIHFGRRETWRAPQRQAYLFQQGRSRPGPLATTTLTSWHSQVDERGSPAGRAVDYDVAASAMPRFHQIAREVGLDSFGADSHDPGHVFLPSEHGLSPKEAALLRTIPRVPEVTLATGLPVDRRLPPGGREQLREASLLFASRDFVRVPVARIVALVQRPDVISQPRWPFGQTNGVVALAVERARTAVR
jgi:hypothetical protein